MNNYLVVKKIYKPLYMYKKTWYNQLYKQNKVPKILSIARAWSMFVPYV